MKIKTIVATKQWDLKAPLTVGGMIDVLEKVFLPTLMDTFATKEDMRSSFDEFEVKLDRKIEKRIRPLENRMNRMEKKMDLGFAQINGQLHEIREEISGMKDSINSLNEKFHAHDKKQKQTEELHVEHLRRINAKIFPHLADKDKKKEYGT